MKFKEIRKKIRKKKKEINNKFDDHFRNLTAKKRCLPDFIIVGAMKCGTSSLYYYLAQHPQIIRGQKKEVHYFDRDYHKGEYWYRKHFPLQKTMKAGNITGEATPYYLFHPHAAQRIAKLMPGIKIIVILRNPAKRAISHYFHTLNNKKESLSLEEALKSENKRINNEFKKMRDDENYYSMECQVHTYKKRGIYIEQIKRYYHYFDSKNILIINSEDLFSDPSESLKEVFRFLGVDNTFVPKDTMPRNTGNKSETNDEVYNKLIDYYLEPNRELYDYLNRDFGW